MVCAFTGYSATLDRGGGDVLDTTLPLSQLASLVTGVCYAGLVVAGLVAGPRRPEPPSAWLRGLLTVTLMLVSVVFLTMMSGDLSETWSLFEHLLTPLAVVVDWLAFGRRQATARWWYPLSWLGPLLVYLVVLVSSDDVIYPFLDPHRGNFPVVILGMLLGVLAGGFAVFGLGRLRGLGGRAGAPYGPGAFGHGAAPTGPPPPPGGPR